MAAKKLTSILLAFTLILSCVIIPTVVSAETDEIEVWDGTVATSFAGGDGSEENPFIIENGAQLAFAIQYNVTDNGKYNKYFALKKDIYLNEIDKVDWATGKAEEGYTPKPWIYKDCKDGNSGWFYGNGHTVYGLYINDPTYTGRAGLVPMTWNGVKFYDFGIDCAYINTKGQAAFFIGYGKSTSSTYTEFENCWVGENSTLIAGGNASAFIYGQFKYATFKDCYSLAKVSSTASGAKVGAFAADIWGTETMWFKNCYGIGAFSLNAGVHPTYENCYSTAQSATGLTKVDAANMVGAKAQTYMPMIGADFAVTESYPVLKAQLDRDPALWGGFLQKPSDADSDGVYEINTPEKMAWYVKNGGKAILTSDLYLNDLKVTVVGGTPALTKVSDGSTIDPNDNDLLEWFGKGTALGTTSSLTYEFNGDGHVIYGLYHNHGELAVGANYAGIFNQIAGGTSIYGVGIEDAYMVSNGSWSAALLVGRENGVSYTIDSCYAGENTYHKGYDAAALCGGGGTPSSPATIKNCYVLTTLSGSHGSTYTNAFTGDNWSASAANYYNCYTSHSRAYRMGTSKVGVYTSVKISEGGGRAAAMCFADLGDAFVTTESYPTLKIFLDEIDPKVNLEMGTSLFEGAGTEADPYLISDAQNLRDMVGLGGMNAYYELTNDIYVNDVNSVDWLTGAVKAGYAPETWFVGNHKDGTGYISYVNANDAFEGTVDGNGYAIHGLYYELGNNSTVGGLIPYANKVTFKNLGIEDSFIGSGRFTGGFVGYGKTINLSGCYLDDSCAVFGWDAGADYVTSDDQITTSSGKLCRASKKTTTYKEDAAGTYILDGTTYRAFTAADYDGIRYAYDEETAAYVESSEGTFLLDGETYREITIADYNGTRYAVDDVIWTGVIFESNALGGLVGRFATSGTIENCYVTATVKSNPIYAFGKEGQGVTFANPGGNGGGMGHIGGLWGDDWASGTTKVVTATDCFSVIKGHENNTNCTFDDVYTLASDAPAGITKVSLAVGNMGLDQMPGLDKNVWYAVIDSTDYPQLRLRGTVIGDVNENGIGAEFADVYALRTTIIGANAYLNADLNRSGTADVCDLVALTKKADENAKADAEANAALLDTVYLSADGSDQNDGTENAPVATLNKAVTLVQDFGTVIIDGTVTVTSTAKSGKTVLVQGGTVDFSSLSTVNVNSGMVFLDGTTVKFADGSTVYANGNMVVINEGVTVEGTPAAIYGGGTRPVRYTSLWLKAGNYKAIYGGGDGAAVLGSTELQLAGTVNATLPLTASGASYIYGGGKNSDVYGATYVYVGGKVNEPLDHTSHTAIARIYGGCNGGTVMRDTVLDIAENAEFNYIYGGGAGTSEVKGATNIYFSGKAMSIYGGSGTVYETNVTVNGGWVHQVFGGCESASMTGNTNVTINGGYIDRRIVGGCYNDASLSGLSMKYASEHYVTGRCTVTLRDEATYNLKGDDHGITALSRHSTNHTDEEGVLVFENTALQTKLKSNLGISWLLGTLAPAADSQIIGE